MAARRWPHVRAALIALACVVGLVDGCPIGSPKDMEGTWAAGFVEAIRPVQHAALAPFAPLGRLFKLNQRWALMQGARADRFRLRLEARTSPTGEWTLLYRAADPDYTAFASILDHTRVAGVYNPGRTIPSQYTRFSTWFLSYVLVRMPDLHAVRIGLEPVHLDGGTLTPSGTLTAVATRVRR